MRKKINQLEQSPSFKSEERKLFSNPKQVLEIATLALENTKKFNDTAAIRRALKESGFQDNEEFRRAMGVIRKVMEDLRKERETMIEEDRRERTVREAAELEAQHHVGMSGYNEDQDPTQLAR